jgi:sRNA-binding protein
MEMEMAVQEPIGFEAAEGTASLALLLERLTVAATQLEQAAASLVGREASLQASGREAELEQKLAEANATLAALRTGRKTTPAGVPSLLAREGATPENPHTLDTALSSLSVEQRIAVKAGLLRSGILG